MPLKVLGIIPARYASTRFPGKPLIEIGGKSMIQRVYEQSLKAASLTNLVVATDNEKISEHVKNFGNVILTSRDHPSGTDRCAEAAEQMSGNYDVILNIQGDEPFIHPEMIDLVVSCFRKRGTQISTLARKIEDDEDIFNPHVPKVVVKKNKEALYFSRAPIPFMRNLEKGNWCKNHTYFRHIGLYGFKAKVLAEVTKLTPSSLEISESLEQLRWLENGYRINVEFTTHESISIDTPADLEKIKPLMKEF